MATIRKLFTFSSTHHSQPSAGPSSSSTQHQKQPDRHAKGAPPELSMDELLAQHMAMRSMRMFEAEEEEARARIQTETPNPAPPIITTFRPPRRPTVNVSTRTTRELLTAAVDALAAQPHLHPRANLPIEQDPLAEMTRTDRSVRTTALANITSIMRDTKMEARAAALKMKKVRDSCRKAGVPFSELLEEEIEGFKMTPLVIEVIRCDFEKDPDLLLFLLEHSHSRDLLWSVRRGCMLRNDNSNLYEKLRHLIPPTSSNEWDPPAFEYEVSLQAQDHYLSPISNTPSSLPNEFRLLISIPNFPAALLADALALAKRRSTPLEKRGDDGLLRPEAGLVVEWIACGRCWNLEVGSNRLALSLIDGEPVSVDARMTVIREERPTVLPRLMIAPIPGITMPSSARTAAPTFNLEPPTPSHEPTSTSLMPNLRSSYSEPHSAVSLRPLNDATANAGPPPRPPRAPRALVFPVTTLHPVRSKGPSKVTLAPCFPPYAGVTSFVKSVLSSKELLVELVVRLDVADPSRIEAGRRASVGGRSFFSGGSEKAPSRKGSEFGDVFEEDSPIPEEEMIASSSSAVAPDPIRSSSYHL